MFIVEKLLGVSETRSGIWYRVRWAAPYNDPEFDTWEPYKTLARDLGVVVLSKLEEAMNSE